MKTHDIANFRNHLIEEEKSAATVEKYVRDVNEFLTFINSAEITKIKLVEYKAFISERYAPASVNSVIASLNCYFNFIERHDLKLKTIKIQKRIFINKERELTKDEYNRIVKVAKTKNLRLYYLMQTICATGIRVSEVGYITVDAVKKGVVKINCKGKIRQVLLPVKLCKLLDAYIKKEKIKNGPVFVTKNGKPLDRSNIWKEMKKLCKDANVAKEKVFPHNLRHLFARTYYSIQKDIVRLADILGHSSINTTRIYTMETGEVHRQQIEKLGLLRC